MTHRSLAFLTLLFTLTAALAACDTSFMGRQHDELVVEYGDDGTTMTRCYMLRRGDSIPSDSDSFLMNRRTKIRVVDGDWKEALARVGLTADQCAQLAH